MTAKPECINIRICPTTNVLISDNLPVRKSYFESNIIARILRRFFSLDYLKWTSTEAHVYMRRHRDAKVKHFDVSNVIYHKFSHGTVSYTPNGKNVNVMLELTISSNFKLIYDQTFIEAFSLFSVTFFSH